MRGIKKIKILLIAALVGCVFGSGLCVSQEASTAADNNQGLTEAKAKELDAVKKQVGELDKPLYTPFIERYVLDEIKQLRADMANQRVELTQQILDRDLMVSDRAMTYSTNTVTYFFYLIAAVSSVLVIVGWTSIRDIKGVADKEVQKLVATYEKRLRSIEKQLTQKSVHIDENRIAIERTQELHSLWLRAAQESSDHNKIAIYDEILKVSPYDCEAMTYKADSALDVGEPQWAKNLCMQVIEREPEYGHAHFQLACANVALGYFDEAVTGLSDALTLSPSVAEDIRNDPALSKLHEYPAFLELLESHGLTLNTTVQTHQANDNDTPTS